MKAKTHELKITLRFNKKCSRRVALREARDILYGLYYTMVIDDSDPETMRVTGIKSPQVSK